MNRVRCTGHEVHFILTLPVSLLSLLSILFLAFCFVWSEILVLLNREPGLCYALSLVCCIVMLEWNKFLFEYSKHDMLQLKIAGGNPVISLMQLIVRLSYGTF